MSYQRLAYDDASSAHEMYTDCEAVGSSMRLPERRSRAERTEAAALKPAPSIYFEDYPREVRKSEIKVSEAAARLASAMHLHLD